MISSPSSTSPLVIFKGADGSATSSTSPHYTAKQHYSGRHSRSPAPGKHCQPAKPRPQQRSYYDKTDRAVKDGHSDLRQAPVTPFPFSHTTLPLENFAATVASQTDCDSRHISQNPLPHSPSCAAVTVPAGIRNQVTEGPSTSSTATASNQTSSDVHGVENRVVSTDARTSAVKGEGRAKGSSERDTSAAIAANNVNTNLTTPNAFPMAQKRPSPYSLAKIARQNDAAAASLASPTTHATATSTTTPNLSSTAAGKNEHVDQVAVVAEQQGSPPSSKRRRSQPNAPKTLPRDYSAVDPSDLVILISSMLMELIQYNDKIPLRDGRLTRFHSRSPPRIGVQQYLERLTVHATLSPPVLLSMVYYIDRLCALYPAFTISSLTVHRFLICAATVASKGLSDSFWSNKTYAKVGGISMEELALLELELLFKVEWRIVPKPEVLVDYYLSLVERCEGYELDSATPRKALRPGLHGEQSGEESSDDSDSSDSSSDAEGDDDEASFTDSRRS
ncbi:hypothetical protein KEM56_001535 [Ascosphaera pollenicola]|nr:hypothetical protein KEM56_001535 [Ascosphaera pollenicola]